MPDATRTRVRVRDLRILADVGVNSDEVGRRQPLVLTVVLTLRVGAVADLSQTVDYRQIAAAVEEIAAIHVPLIETFADRLCHVCLGWENVVEAYVSIDKPFALPGGLAGVEVVLENQQAPPWRRAMSDGVN